MSRFWLVFLCVQIYLLILTLAKYNSPVKQRIWNGWNEDDITHFPYHASVVLRDNFENETEDLYVLCGGTIVSANAIITAAHCVFEQLKEEETIAGWMTNYVVIYGTTNSTDDLRFTKDLRDKHVKYVREVIVHPLFYGGSDFYGRFHDIALCKTHGRIYFTLGSVMAIDLPGTRSLEDFVVPEEGDLYYLAGRGKSAPTEGPADNLRATVMKVKNNTWCRKAYTMAHWGPNEWRQELFDPELQLCADGNTSHVCIGDFGGGLVGVPHRKSLHFYEDPPETHKLMAVLSYAPIHAECGSVFPSIFTRIRKRDIEWIRSNWGL